MNSFILFLIMVANVLQSEVVSLSLPHKYDEEDTIVEFAVETDSEKNVKIFCERHDCAFIGKVTSKYFHIKCKERKLLKEYGEDTKLKDAARNSYGIKSLEKQKFDILYPKTNDPKWPDMWNLNGEIFPNTRVQEAWKQGFNGSGITIAVVDDGIQINHPDLKNNIDVANSYDYNDQDLDITPADTADSHGTMVCGIIAAEANNNVCIVGVAPASTIFGVRLTAKPADDITKAKALTHHLSKVDIYSSSWGAIDKIGYEGFGPVSDSALFDGVTLGRNGKGAIYVFAAGNGGLEDNCNLDGYASHLYTIPITSIGIDEVATPYSEVCASAFAATYSGINERNLTTTYPFSECVDDGIQGTSFSAPEASAIVALVLQANPLLTWRDVQHLIVQTSKRHNITDGFGKQPWQINGAGLNVSQVVGFGLMDAEAMVSLAKSWTLVDPQIYCSSAIINVVEIANNTQNLSVSSFPDPQLNSTVMESGERCSIKTLEKVQVEVFLGYLYRRGDITLILESPSGTVSYLMTPRPEDSALTDGIPGLLTWTFTSVHFWGEGIQGNWKLSMKHGSGEIADTSIKNATDKSDEELFTPQARELADKKLETTYDGLKNDYIHNYEQQ